MRTLGIEVDLLRIFFFKKLTTAKLLQTARAFIQAWIEKGRIQVLYHIPLYVMLLR